MLTLYGRSFCHLCEDMLAALQPLTERLDFQVRFVDIEDDPVLEERFGEWIPVLMAGEEEICHYFLEEDRLLRYFGTRRIRLE